MCSERGSRERLQAGRKKAAIELAAGGITEANPKEESVDGSDSETHNSRSRRTTKASKPAAQTGGVWPPVVRARGSRPATDVAEDSAYSNSVFDRLGLLP